MLDISSVFFDLRPKKIYSEGWIHLQRDRMGRLEVPSQTKAVYILCLCELLHTWEILEEHKRLKKGEEPSSQRIKAFLCPLLPTWAPLNAICLNNDQNIIDTMRLLRAQSFNSAPLRMEKRKTEKERKNLPWCVWGMAHWAQISIHWCLNWNPQISQF